MSEHNDKCRVGRISCGEKVCDGCQYRIRDKSPVSEQTELPELAVGYMDQGMGHGHYAVIRKDSEKLFANVPFGDKNLATQVVRACNSHKVLLDILKDIRRHAENPTAADLQFILNLIQDISQEEIVKQAAIAKAGE